MSVKFDEFIKIKDLDDPLLRLILSNDDFLRKMILDLSGTKFSPKEKLGYINLLKYWIRYERIFPGKSGVSMTPFKRAFTGYLQEWSEYGDKHIPTSDWMPLVEIGVQTLFELVKDGKLEKYKTDPRFKKVDEVHGSLHEPLFAKYPERWQGPTGYN